MTDQTVASPSAAARRAMIDSQLRTSGVTEPRVLAAMAGIAREDFVPTEMRHCAYIDRAIPLGDGRLLASPLVHGRMLAEGAPTNADKALLVGDGDGYLAAVLRPLVGSLDTLSPDAAKDARGKGAYTLIVVDGAIEALPRTLSSQLAEGGRMVCGIAERGLTRLAAGRKTAGEVTLLPLADMGIPVLGEFAAPKGWSF